MGLHSLAQLHADSSQVHCQGFAEADYCQDLKPDRVAAASAEHRRSHVDFKTSMFKPIKLLSKSLADPQSCSNRWTCLSRCTSSFAACQALSQKHEQLENGCLEVQLNAVTCWVRSLGLKSSTRPNDLAAAIFQAQAELPW